MMKEGCLSEIEAPFPWKEIRNKLVIGVDEVGRGCLAGPVFAAAVCLDPQKQTNLFVDSKKISSTKREQRSAIVFKEHHAFVAQSSVEEIERLNILHASFLAMKRAVEGLLDSMLTKEAYSSLQRSSLVILVDGHLSIPETSYPQIPLVKGDARAEPIGAASIVAKVARDEHLKEIGQLYPQYEFYKHKGYGTLLHRHLIEKYGPCIEHRKSFSGVKEWIREKSCI